MERNLHPFLQSPEFTSSRPSAPVNPNVGKLQAMPAPYEPQQEESSTGDGEASDLEERLRKFKKVPSWYKGEEGAYKYATMAMKGVATIPKG